MFRWFKNRFLGLLEDSPALAWTTITSLLLIFILAILEPMRKILLLNFSENAVDSIVTVLVFSIFGAMGIIILRFREAPIFITPITGIIAILIGSFLLLASIGAILLTIFNYFGHPLIR